MKLELDNGWADGPVSSGNPALCWNHRHTAKPALSHVGVGDLESGSCAFVPRTFPNESSPQLLKPFFLK